MTLTLKGAPSITHLGAGLHDASSSFGGRRPSFRFAYAVIVVLIAVAAQAIIGPTDPGVVESVAVVDQPPHFELPRRPSSLTVSELLASSEGLEHASDWLAEHPIDPHPVLPYTWFVVVAPSSHGDAAIFTIDGVMSDLSLMRESSATFSDGNEVAVDAAAGTIGGARILRGNVPVQDGIVHLLDSAPVAR